MKKGIIILLFCLIYNSIEAQNIKGAIIGGLNITQVDGDQVYGFRKKGISVGPSAIIPLRSGFQLALEVLYSQKGSSQAPVYTYEDSTREYRLKLNYAEVPILIQYADKHGLTAGLGISYGRLVFVKEKQYNPLTKKVEWDNVRLNDGTYKKDDFEVIADLKLKLFTGIYANLRYSYSIAKIRTRYFYKPFNKSRDQFNNVISFRLIWVLNDDKQEIKNTKH